VDKQLSTYGTQHPRRTKTLHSFTVIINKVIYYEYYCTSSCCQRRRVEIVVHNWSAISVRVTFVCVVDRLAPSYQHYGYSLLSEHINIARNRN